MNRLFLGGTCYPLETNGGILTSEKGKNFFSVDKLLFKIKLRAQKNFANLLLFE